MISSKACLLGRREPGAASKPVRGKSVGGMAGLLSAQKKRVTNEKESIEYAKVNASPSGRIGSLSATITFKDIPVCTVQQDGQG